MIALVLDFCLVYLAQYQTAHKPFRTAMTSLSLSLYRGKFLNILIKKNATLNHYFCPQGIPARK